jgi:hypothetical protein
MLNEEWIDPTHALIDDKLCFVNQRVWVALNLYGAVDLCRYDWVHGWNPHKFINERGNVYELSEIDAVMIIKKPKHPTYNETSY